MSSFPTKILLATDGSQDAALAALAAIDLTHRARTELHVVHVWQDVRPATLPTAAMNEYLRAFERWEQEAGELLEEQADRLRSAGVTVAGAHLKKGRPADEIVALAEELDAGLAVMGSRGLGTVKRLVVGSVSEGVVGLAPCPVLVVRGAWPPSRVVVGDDSSEEAGRACALATNIGKLFSASVFLVRAHPVFGKYTLAREADEHVSRDIARRTEEALEQRADHLRSVLGERPWVRVVAGDAATAIQEIAEEGGEPTLVAVGRRGLGAVRHFALGSVSSDILRAVSGPVLIVPSLREEPQ
jgi:nucleotide-binding universal stress UspA family protein